MTAGQRLSEAAFLEQLEEHVTQFERLYPHRRHYATFLHWMRAQVSESAEASFKALEQEPAPEQELVKEPIILLDTLNRYGVTAKDGCVVILSIPKLRLAPRPALQLAAWLTVGAELAGYDHVLEVLTATVRAVQNPGPTKEPDSALDTLNHYGVVPDDGLVCTRFSLPNVLLTRSALRLAAWLIVTAELVGYRQALETVVATVKAIQET